MRIVLNRNDEETNVVMTIRFRPLYYFCFARICAHYNGAAS